MLARLPVHFPARPTLLALVLGGTACSRAKVKLKKAAAQPAPPARVVVVPPRAGLGLSELGKAAHMDSAGAALDKAASRLAEGASKQAQKLAGNTAAAMGTAPGAAAVGVLGAQLGGHAEKKRQWFEDAFSQAISGEAQVRVVDPLVGIATVDCDYRLVFDEPPEAPGPKGKRGGVIKASGKLYGAALGKAKSKGEWRVERCWDGSAVAAGDMQFKRTFRWWMLDFFDRYKVKLGEDPVGAMARDFAETAPARTDHSKRIAKVQERRAAGAQAEPGSRIAGIQPRDGGSYASPVRADGSLARWDNRVLAGDLAGAAVQEATKAGIQKVAGKGKLAKTAADLGGSLAGGLTASAITKKLPADHYFADACSLAVWLDAAYAHRADYRDILRATTAVYTELESDFAGCLLQGG
jgi:hypothetical protein